MMSVNKEQIPHYCSQFLTKWAPGSFLNVIKCVKMVKEIGMHRYHFYTERMSMSTCITVLGN